MQFGNISQYWENVPTGGSGTGGEKTPEAKQR